MENWTDNHHTDPENKSIDLVLQKDMSCYLERHTLYPQAAEKVVGNQCFRFVRVTTWKKLRRFKHSLSQLYPVSIYVFIKCFTPALIISQPEMIVKTIHIFLHMKKRVLSKDINNLQHNAVWKTEKGTQKNAVRLNAIMCMPAFLHVGLKRSVNTVRINCHTCIKIMIACAKVKISENIRTQIRLNGPILLNIKKPTNAKLQQQDERNPDKA